MQLPSKKLILNTKGLKMTRKSKTKHKIIKTTGTTLTFCGDDFQSTEIGKLEHFRGLADSGTFKADLDFSIDKEAHQRLKELIGEQEKPIGKLSKGNEVYEGEVMIYKMKENECIKLGARLMTPKKSIDGVAVECDIDYIELF